MKEAWTLEVILTNNLKEQFGHTVDRNKKMAIRCSKQEEVLQTTEWLIVQTWVTRFRYILQIFSKQVL